MMCAVEHNRTGALLIALCHGTTIHVITVVTTLKLDSRWGVLQRRSARIKRVLYVDEHNRTISFQQVDMAFRCMLLTLPRKVPFAERCGSHALVGAYALLCELQLRVLNCHRCCRCLMLMTIIRIKRHESEFLWSSPQYVLSIISQRQLISSQVDSSYCVLIDAVVMPLNVGVYSKFRDFKAWTVSEGRL